MQWLILGQEHRWMIGAHCEGNLPSTSPLQKQCYSTLLIFWPMPIFCINQTGHSSCPFFVSSSFWPTGQIGEQVLHDIRWTKL